MKHPEIPFDNPALMFCLALLRTPVRVRALKQLLQLNNDELAVRLHGLKEAGLIRYDNECCRWSAVDEASRQELGRGAARLVPGNGFGNGSGAGFAKRAGKGRENDAASGADPGRLALGLARIWAGYPLEGATLLTRDVRRLVYAAHSAGVLICLDILLQSLEKWENPGQSLQEDKRYVRITHKVLGLVLYMAKRRRQANAVFVVLTQAAERLGDRRTILKVKIMQICLHYMIGDVLEEDPQEAMKEVVREIEEFGDEDILIGTVHGIGIQQYMQGDFAGVIENYRLHNSSFNEGEKFYSGVAVNNVAISACNLGRFGNALGAVQAALRAYSDLGGKYAVKRTMILGGDVLLRAGMPDEALEMMHEAWTSCDAEAESRLAVWALRNLAFYHFQKGRMVYAHRLLTQCAATAEKYSIKTPFRWFPYSYEMLWTFQELGFPPVPGHDLEGQIERALRGPSLLCQGIALRLQARQLNQKGRYKSALALLEASLARLVSCANPMEQARSKLEMAKSLVGAGREAEAGVLHAQGCALLKEYHQYDHSRHCSGAEPVVSRRTGADGAECATGWRESFVNAAEWSTFETHMQEMVDCLRDALRVERVALYTVEDDYRLVNLAARDFSAKEYGEKLPFMYGKRLLDSMQSGQITRWRSRYGACLCLPFQVLEQQHCVFFAHCRYLTDSIMERRLEYFEPVRALVEEELRLAYRVQDSVNAIESKKETRSRLTAERLADEGAVYYGPAMQEVLEQADKAAPTTASVLILGETGAGKEELSRRLHRKSGRTGPFIVVNLSSIPEQLFESELFGHEKGAFTGAQQQKVGLLELADQGTLFIDEIGELSLSLQVKLLRVLQEKQFARLGGIKLLQSDFRLITATNQDLQEKIRDGSFREDFYYRIAVVPLAIPPLRERPGDIRQLALMFHANFSSDYKIAVPPLSSEELDYLASLPWPGNVRELRSLIERGVILYDPAKGGFLQEPWAVPGRRVESAAQLAPGREESLFACTDLPSMEELQKRYIAHVLKLTRGRVGGEGGAERILDMKLSTLYKKLKKYGLDKTSLIYGSSK